MEIINERKLKKLLETGPKFKLNLCILVTHLYTKFQFKMSICNGDNEPKLKIIGIFLKPHSYGENMLTCANLHMSRFAHASKSKFAMRSDESYVP